MNFSRTLAVVGLIVVARVAAQEVRPLKEYRDYAVRRDAAPSAGGCCLRRLKKGRARRATRLTAGVAKPGRTCLQSATNFRAAS